MPSLPSSFRPRVAALWAGWPHRWLLFALECGLLYGSLALSLKIRFGDWVLPSTSRWAHAVHLTLLTYALAVVAGGLYRTSVREMHLPEFLRAGGVLAAAWIAAVALSYLGSPRPLLPRSVMSIFGLSALVALLGERALLRWALEQWAPSQPAAPPHPPPPPLTLRDLVDRDPVKVNRAALRNNLSDRTVLVTGAGGSIGTELSKQLVDLTPFRLVLVDISEYNLYQLEKALRGTSFKGDIEFCIGDVRDEAVVDNLFERTQPDVVLHTAAYKHVPLMERHPAEAFRNNTLATVHLLRLCERYDTDQFVFVSTDKAVEPTSVLGATKRLAEWYVQAAPSRVQRSIVRFGNVFGSQGSVVPLFEDQLARGEPVTVTHPDMERYFMSINEACGLILQTVLFDEAPVYCFRMGAPLRIDRIARTLVRRWYPSVDPDMMIEYVGRRPGEKLSEDLVMPYETARPTPHDSIVGLHGTPPHTRTELEAYFRHLRTLSTTSDASPARLRRALFADHVESVLNAASG
ncbi:MAG: SDR family NAD(P)-dependent oxidoreductase [Salinivenus sp.]